MSALLFPDAPAPVAPRWRDPTDEPRRRATQKKQPGQARRVPNVDRSEPAHNPWRQPIADADELEFRHMHWQAIRNKVRPALLASGTGSRSIDRFDNCGAECLIEWSESEKRYRLRASYCRNRHCQACMKARQQLIAKNLRAKLEGGTKNEGDRFRFFTFTLRHTSEPLKDQIKKLYKCFALLRRTKVWKNSQKGGAVTFENKRNERGEWHPHLHVIAEGDYIRQDDMANEWSRITGGSFKADVRRIKSANDAANYVAKYVGKGADASVWKDPVAAIEWVCATRGLRSCATFGTWRGFRLLKVDPAHEATDWKPVALLTQIARQARAGSIADANLLYLLSEALVYNPLRVRNRDHQPLVDT